MSDPVPYGLPPPDNEPKEPAQSSIFVIIGGLVVAALGFIVVGVGFAVGWWGPTAEEDEPVAEAPTEPSATDTGEPEAPAALPGAELMPAPDEHTRPAAFEEVDPFAGAEPVPEIMPAGDGGSGGGASTDDGSSGSAEAKAHAKWTGPRVQVTLALGHYEQVELKLGGRVVTLTSNRKVRLRPGGYRVELRKSPEAPWKPAGLIELEAGKRYRVTLFDPPLAKLEVLE
jgi:hypothetical protein